MKSRSILDYIDYGDEKDNKQEGVEEERLRYYVRGLTGLENMGNTCYMNSIIQCLSTISVFRSYVSTDSTVDVLFENMSVKLNRELKKEAGLKEDTVRVSESAVEKACKNTIMWNLYQLFIEMWIVNGFIEPKSLKKTIGDYCDIFKGYSQNDSQELLNLLLDKLHEELGREEEVEYKNIPENVSNYLDVKKQCGNVINDKSLDIEERKKFTDYLHNYSMTHINDMIIGEAHIYWLNYIKKSFSVVTELFTGLFLSKLICMSCGYVTVSFEPFTILTLPIEDYGSSTLNELLEAFCKEELLCGDNKYHCPECKKKTDALKSMKIWLLPNILIIQLKRFKKRFKNEVWETSKKSSKVIFPLIDLDIKNYISDLCYINKTKYNLIAVNNHIGDSDEHGHYTTYAMNQINNEWYEFDDNVVFHIPEKNLEEVVVTCDAYILFYIRNID